MIKKGMVKVNGKEEVQRGKKLYSGDCIEIISDVNKKFLIE